MPLLFLPLLASAACAAALIVIGITKRSARRIGLGTARLSVITPLTLTLADEYRLAVTVGELLVVGHVVAWFVECATARAGAEVLLGALGLLAFWAHVFLLANAP